jgi:ABC-type transporter Mla subunit MlaD
MAEKQIQIKQHNGTDWDALFPKTKASITLMNNGKTVEVVMSEVLTSLNNKTTLSQVTTEIEKVVGTAPAALDTLQELSTALNNDPTFGATLTTSLSNKVDKVAGKGLSAEDFTTTLKNKLSTLQDHSSDITSLQTGKADKTSVYTKTEVDNKISESTTGIPVSSTEPTGAELWFEELL